MKFFWGVGGKRGGGGGGVGGGAGVREFFYYESKFKIIFFVRWGGGRVGLE